MDEVRRRVEEVLRKLGPSLSVDGGGVELDRIEDGTAFVRLTGACIDCPGADITLQYGIESAVTQAVPEITRVVALEEGSSPAPGATDERS